MISRPPDLIKFQGPQPQKSYSGDAGWDLVSTKEVLVGPEMVADIPTGLFMAMPHGFWAHLVSRSSTTKRHGVIVLDGIIDNGYRGEMFVQVYNPNGGLGGQRRIPAGTRLAQLIFHRIYEVSWLEQAILPEATRGINGFGSSGR